jgi:hypothetical protein
MPGILLLRPAAQTLACHARLVPAYEYGRIARWWPALHCATAQLRTQPSGSIFFGIRAPLISAANDLALVHLAVDRCRQISRMNHQFAGLAQHWILVKHSPPSGRLQ